MEIHDISNNNGIVSLNLGPAKLIESYLNFLHIVNLKQYEQNIRLLEISIKSLNKITLLEQSLNITTLKIQALKDKLSNLMPNYRTKRGLINGLGTLIKGRK